MKNDKHMAARIGRRNFIGNSVAVAASSLLGGGLVASSSAQAGTTRSNNCGIVSVKSFGAIGDGVADDTAALQAALDILGPGVILQLDGLTLKISGPVSVYAKTGFVLDGIGATIIAENGMPVVQGNNLLFIHESTNFTVCNLIVDGNRATRTPAEVWSHNIAIHSCQRFIFEQVTSNNAVVDGFYFSLMDTLNFNDTSTYNRDFQMHNCFADNCYRQGASVINAYDFLFMGGAYTNSNGTAPQAGIDVESNDGPTIGNARGRFYGCRFEGNAGYGLVLSSVAGAKSHSVDSCYFSANDGGGISIGTPDTHIRACEFVSHSGINITQGIVSFPANPDITSGSISECSFKNNTNTTSAIYLHPLTSGVSVLNNKIDSHTGNAINMAGSRHRVEMNSITNCGGLGIVAHCTNGVVSENYIKAATKNGIYGGSNYPRLRIISNIIEDIVSVSGAYIQCVSNDCEIQGNTCSAELPTSDYGIRVDGSSLGIHGNICINLNSTDPYIYSTSGINDDLVYNNVGGTANDRRIVKSGMASPSFYETLRPDAATVAPGQCIFNVTTGQPNWSDGTNWVDASGAIT